ncbi:MAG: hypothetical protein CMO80_10680 [Verrucomicrobiales bacterium]|nr:hypothetical protein [Verrucomicrobiales bacterium]|tara:strand:- start:10714 stop:10995 length:282 start_codon:yes stop_codon:yes gene_type:complete
MRRSEHEPKRAPEGGHGFAFGAVRDDVEEFLVGPGKRGFWAADVIFSFGTAARSGAAWPVEQMWSVFWIIESIVPTGRFRIEFEPKSAKHRRT